MDIEAIANQLETDWKDVLVSLLAKHKESIDEKLAHDIHTFKDVLDVVPPPHLIFNAFNMFDQCDLKVCIIGMDPYIHKGEAMGLSFSVPNGTKCPPSLRNIFKELAHEYGVIRTNTDLTLWAKQGVLLLNTALTTLENKTGHHMKIWREPTQDIVKYIAHHFVHIVYILWGSHAQSYEGFIDPAENLVLKHTHPSPLSRKSFVGNGHFKMCNAYLAKHNKKEINWLE